MDRNLRFGDLIYINYVDLRGKSFYVYSEGLLNPTVLMKEKQDVLNFENCIFQIVPAIESKQILYYFDVYDKNDQFDNPDAENDY